MATLALAQAATPSVYSDEAASKAVVRIFKEACTEGALSLPPERGRILKESELTDFTDVLSYFRAKAQKTVVRFNHPRGTFLIFADYRDPPPKSIGRECVVVSRVLSIYDAMAALMETAPDMEPRRAWMPNMYRNAWTIDARKRGFKSSMLVRSDRSILLAIGTYASAMDKNPIHRVNSK